MARIELRKRKSSTKNFLSGSNCELFLNGKRLSTARSLDFHIDARGIAVANIEVVVQDFKVDGNVKVKTKKVKRG